MSKVEIFRTFVRFGLVGVLATVLHYGIYWVLQRFIEVNTAYTIAYFLAFIANFYLTSYFTFGTSPTWRKLIGMGGAHLINWLFQLVLLNLFIWLGVHQKWAPLPVFAISVPVNFLLVRFVFTAKNKK